MNRDRAQRALLFGSIAYRLGVLDAGALVRLLTACAADPSRPVDDALRMVAGCDEESARRVVAAARDLLALHGDPPRALAALPLDAAARDALAGVDAPNFRAEVTRLVLLWRAADDAAATYATMAEGTESWAEPTFAVGEGSTLASAAAGPASAARPDAPGDDPERTVSGGVTEADPEAPPGAPARKAGEKTEALGTVAMPEGDATVGPSMDAAAPAAERTARQDDGNTRTDADATVGFAAPSDADRTVAQTSAQESGPTLAVPSSRRAGPGPGREARGRYRVVRAHARGGLGEVFVAVDGELNREVALKEIQGRHADDPVSRARFVVEAEVTGGLEHPGIVPVYGLGEDVDGRPYYAMRFVRGESLKEAINRFHAPPEPDAPAPAETGSRELEFFKLLRRFVDVCNALEYAHARGVLHRDLKPANVMLGPFGETLVVDWGLAKPLDRPDADEAPGLGRARAAGLSGDAGPGTGRLRPQSASGSMYQVLFGSTVGTPQYMSPEQAEGDELGPASDVYSLGATLYNLLTGQPPFTERAIRPLLEKVRAGDFPPPRQVNPKVPAALEAVCLKAMALRPEDRYPSARAMAEDVEHWMADDPVSAYPEPWTARAARWARRHRTFVTTAAALLVTAVVGLGTATYLIERERARTEANFVLARSAVDTMLTRLAAIDLMDIPGAEGVRREMLEKARDFYLTFLRGREGRRPSVRQGAAMAIARLGELEDLLGDYRRAEANYRRAIDRLTPLALGPGAGDDPESLSHRRDLARARHGLGLLLTRLSRYQEAEAELTAAVDHRKRLASHKTATAQDVADHKESLYRLGALLARRPGNQGKARAYYDDALKQAASLVKGEEPGPSRPGVHDDPRRTLARYQNQLGTLMSRSGDEQGLNTALELFDAARTVLEDLHESALTVAGYTWDLARTWSNLATVRLRREPEAKPADPASDPVVRDYSSSVDLLRQLANDYPGVPEYRFELAEVLMNRSARHLRPLAQKAPAARDLTDALAALSVLARDHPGRPDYALRLAECCRRLAAITDDKARAEAELRRSLADLEALAKAFPEYSQSIDYRLALVQATASLATRLRDDPRLADLAPSLTLAADAGRTLFRNGDANPDAVRATYNCLLLLAKVQKDRKQYDAAVRLILDRLPYLDTTQPGQGGKLAYEAASCLTEAADPRLTAKYAPEVLHLLKVAVRDGLIKPADFDFKGFKALEDMEDFQELKRSVKTARAVEG
jgi:serine/threonine-protein kinase